MRVWGLLTSNFSVCFICNSALGLLLMLELSLLIYDKVIRSDRFLSLVLDKAKGDRVPISTLAVRCKPLKCFAFVTVSACWCGFEICSKFIFLNAISTCLSDLNPKFLLLFPSDRSGTPSSRPA